MKNLLKNISLYILSQNNDLSRSVLTKIVYLLDYFYVKNFGKQYTDIEWFFDNYGPFVYDVVHSIADEPDISLNIGPNSRYYRYEGTAPQMDDPNVIDIIEFINKKVNSMSYSDFIKYVYETEPVVHTDQYNVIDIQKCIDIEKQKTAEASWDETVSEYDEVLQALAQ